MEALELLEGQNGRGIRKAGVVGGPGRGGGDYLLSGQFRYLVAGGISQGP